MYNRFYQIIISRRHFLTSCTTLTEVNYSGDLNLAEISTEKFYEIFIRNFSTRAS